MNHEQGEAPVDRAARASGWRARLDVELDRFVADGLRRSTEERADTHELWQQLGRTGRGGEKLRSTLLFAAYECCGGDDDEVVARVGAAVELLHTALVIHDDVIDRDVVRRGSANVSGVFADTARVRGAREEGAVTLGVAAGILAGDLALARAIHLVALCGADAATTRALLALVEDAVRVSAAGELDDVAAGVCRATAPTLEQVLAIAEQKTAWYSFRFPLQAGAVLAGAPGATVDQLAEVGRLAGIGFQLADDLRGVFGDESDTGKSALSDLREGKFTALIAHARTTAVWNKIAPHIGDASLEAGAAETVRELLQSCGSRRFVEGLAEHHLTRAEEMAERIGLDPALLTELTRHSRRIMRSTAA